MWEIIDHLYLGDKRSCQLIDEDYIKGIDVMVNCAKELPCLYEEDGIEYFH
jgi:hypothetical protein